MSSNVKSAEKKALSSGFVLGRARFARISAVEGIALTAAMTKRAEEFDRLGLSPDERRREILKVYRGKHAYRSKA